MQLASIIIPTYNLSKLTLKCLAALFTNTAYSPVELIWVDNQSRNAQRQLVTGFLSKYCQWPYQSIMLDENQGWTGGCIAGYERAKGDIIILLNNDTEPDELWLSALAMALRKNPHLGVVGCVTDNKIQFQGLPKLRKQWPDLAGAEDGRWLRMNRWGQARPVNAVAFFAVALRRTMLNEIGFLDPCYEIGFGDDDDLCLRARRAGWDIGIALSSFVPHLHRATFKYREVEEGWDWKQLKRRNAAIFRARKGVKMEDYELPPRTILRFMGKGGFPFLTGVPARDLTWGDLTALEIEQDITKEDLLKARKNSRDPLYVDVGLQMTELFGPGPFCGAIKTDGKRCQRSVKEWGDRCWQHPDEALEESLEESLKEEIELPVEEETAMELEIDDIIEPDVVEPQAEGILFVANMEDYE